MADVGDLDFVGCDCPGGPVRFFAPGTPSAADVGDFDFPLPCVCTLGVFAAYALDGQTIRVVFATAPLFRSPAGFFDAMNPTNYALSIAVGDATAPRTTTVSPVLVVGPTRFVGNGGNVGQRGVDVHVDRPLVEGVSYRVTISNIVGVDGSVLGASVSAAFGGVTLLRSRAPNQRGKPTTNVDVASDIVRGSWYADDSGDLAPQDALSGYRKRVFRRLTTPRNAWAFLKGYGLGQRLKGTASTAQVAALKADAEQQIMMEPETAKVSISVTISALDYLTFSVKAWTRAGAFVEMSVQVGPDGRAALLSAA